MRWSPQYIIRGMSPRMRAAVLAVIVAAGLAAAGCNNSKFPFFGKRYEYEEDLTLSLDGSATLTVNASLASLVALRGLDLDLRPGARVDLEKIRAAYQSPYAEVQRVSPPWTRAGRRFAQIRLRVPDIRRLSEARPFSWSRYELTVANGHHLFHQRVGASALRPGTLQNAGWNGSEVVAFRLHLPSKIISHNARDPDTNETVSVARGNLIAWEQHLTDRLDGAPLDMRVEMDSQSILYRTLWLFGGAFAAAVLVLAGLIWWTMRRGAAEETAPVP
jgi:hypothetical protein